MIETLSGAERLTGEAAREIYFPRTMTEALVERWGDGIPSFSDADPLRPEWRATRVLRLNELPNVLVKDESDPLSNPTRTVKDRAAWELGTLYRDFARACFLDLRSGRFSRNDLHATLIPRLTLITSGNEGRAVAECFARYGLPPPKIVVSNTLPLEQPRTYDALRKLRADLYLADLSVPLAPEEIRHLSHNDDGIDITSVRSIEPNATFYDWQVHEVFGEEPDEVYVPYGSGRLTENYLTWQDRTRVHAATGQRDPRLTTSPDKVRRISILAAEPERSDSIADKLTAPFKPFLLFKGDDMNALRQFMFTGPDTQKDTVSEAFIDEAHRMLLGNGIDAEPSGAAGLALYLKRLRQGATDSFRRVVVVNTGMGLYEGKE